MDRGLTVLVQEVFEQILAGSDTTAAAIRIILLYLMKHPRVYAKLQAEIDEAVQGGKALASPGIISDAQARRLPYLGAVVREGMRMHPPVANLFSKVAPDEGDVAVINGKEYFIPGGTATTKRFMGKIVPYSGPNDGLLILQMKQQRSAWPR